MNALINIITRNTINQLTYKWLTKREKKKKEDSAKYA